MSDRKEEVRDKKRVLAEMFYDKLEEENLTGMIIITDDLNNCEDIDLDHFTVTDNFIKKGVCPNCFCNIFTSIGEEFRKMFKNIQKEDRS